MPSLFKIPIEKLKGVGPKSGELFRKLGIDTVGAMIRFYPRTYEDWSDPYSISEAPVDTPACVKATVEEVSRPVVGEEAVLLRICTIVHKISKTLHVKL